VERAADGRGGARGARGAAGVRQHHRFGEWRHV
jgi:hypothetical protein